MSDEKYSRDFFVREFACPCCGVSKMNQKVINKLQAMRSSLGKRILISEGGGYRCQKYQDLYHPDMKSAHVLGEAADIKCSSSSKRYRLVQLIYAVSFKRFGVYDKHLHVDIAKDSEGFPPRVTWVGISL